MNLFTCTDVTAVKIYKNCVLAGIGSKINIFNKLSTKLWQRVDGLNGQKIYGFQPSQCGDKILVFGGKQFTVLSVSFSTDSGLDDRLFYKLFEPIVSDDWIHSAVWIGDNKVALLTAHNVVQKWDTSTQTVMSRHPSKDNSILYSGLLLPLGDDLLAMAGTVFSEVIIHRIGDQEPLHNLKGHKGVIFSISCKPEHNMIVTTSDDRSVRLWRPNDPPIHSHDSIDYWATVNFVCHHELYGHMARVMRSCITNNLVISVGEDSFICYWDYHGKLLRKVLCHQNSAIWSIDSDTHKIVTGGGDGAVVMHPLTVATDYCKNETINIDIDTPKKVVFTARRNIVLLDANNLIHYNFDTGNKTVFKLIHETTYQMLSVSSCKQMIAVTDMNGKLDVFIENCKDEACIIKIIDTVLNIGKILSMQFAGNRHIVLCTENGEINILASNNKDIEVYGNYILPPCKERWLTASAIGSTNKILIAGDRCGSVHVYVRGEKHPVRSFSKVHGRYGPTSINIRNNEVVTTGRDGSVKYFTINKNDGVKYMCARDLDFQWVEKFLDKDETMICGFQERVFVVYNVKDNSRILEVLCGGGHRSWDAIRYFDKENNDYEEYIKLIYLKNSDINLTTFKLSDIVSTSIINGSHSKEINCLKTYTNDFATFYITGGEDTTLRISSLNRDMKFKDEVVFKHLSSIRALKTYVFDDNYVLISAGGRAQICIKNIKFLDDNNQISIKSEELIDYMIKGTDKERKGNQTWRNCTIDFDPEMRIMDLAVTHIDDKIIIFAGCSDAFLRVFTFRHKLEPIRESKYHSTCILKTNLIKILNKCVLITCTTRGDVAFWDVSDLTKLTPFFATKTNKSGINAFTSTILSKDMILIGTGGDDNAIHLVLLKIQDLNNLSSMQVLNTWSTDKHHSSQITGLLLVDKFLLSASIDQRVTLFEWEVKDNIVRCDFVSQAFTDVADVQGMELLSHKSDAITICVFGKGMEVLDVRKSQ